MPRPVTKDEVAAQQLSPKEANLKELLGDDYDSFVQFRDRQAQRAKATQARDAANAMVAEGGKYFEQYSKLEAQLDAIWEKALREARAKVGLVEEEVA